MRSRKIGIAVAFCILLAVGYTSFTYEAKALFWHLTHARTLQWRDLEINVPLKYDVNTTASRTIQIFTIPGRLRSRWKTPWGAISVIRAKDAAEGSEIVQLDERIATGRQGQGFRLVKTRSLAVAGTPMQCRELLAENFRSYGPASSVYCQADSTLLFVQFEGSAALLDEFYSVASGIRPAAKH
jgi:hypothetical protein